IKGEKVFKVIAYRRGAEAIRSQGRDINAIWEEGSLEKIPGVGKAISEKTDELLRTGELEYYENLKSEIPIGLLE
ncbi:MAG: DNA polymerase/3'-5' exonuclease PolX, partial [Candidatus Latescibacteria bacterium]|nr:DNA polymerase/3'-5' exonuclease PolX [Candidatus Latescibacterota bacterium]NIO77059.1 DNA polymerase/3'-5' exonuclease PolX [Candidatus Latescibacterota bacterium]